MSVEPDSPLPSLPRDPVDDPVRIAGVGLGYWGPNLARAWSAAPETSLTWLCDLDPRRLARAGVLHPEARLTEQLDDVLSDPEVEAVAIATGATSHRALAERALRAGKHVFVEKPLATTVEDARFLARLAREQDRALFVGHLLVHHPAVAKLMELSASGELGETRYIYTQRVNLGQVRADENALWSLGAHDVSVIMHLLGGRPESVSAQGQSFIRPGVEDVVFCLLRFPNGVIAHLQLSWLDPYKTRRVTVVGSAKMAVFDDMSLDQKVTVYDKGVTTTCGEPGATPASYGEYVQVRFGDTFIPRISSEEPLRRECRQFARAVRGVEVAKSGADEGVAVVEVLDALQVSLERGGEPVTLAELDRSRFSLAA
jgi:predicted dehydrogenase